MWYWNRFRPLRSRKFYDASRLEIEAPECRRDSDNLSFKRFQGIRCFFFRQHELHLDVQQTPGKGPEDKRSPRQMSCRRARCERVAQFLGGKNAPFMRIADLVNNFRFDAGLATFVQEPSAKARIPFSRGNNQRQGGDIRELKKRLRTRG
jgi:hypothetical protein